MSSIRHPLETALDRELRRMERVIVRAWLVLSAVGVGLALVIAFTISKPLGLPMAAMGALLFVLFSISRKVGKWSRPFLMTVEALMPWAFFGVLEVTQGAAYALASWVPPLLFAALILAWVARLEPIAPIVISVAGAATFLAVYFVMVHPNVPQGAAHSIIHDPPMQISRAFSICISGFIGAAIARALRGAIGRADLEVRREEIFGKYRIIGKIGAGSGGTVHEAVYCPEGGFERRVAVKQLHPTLVSEPKFVEGFRAEAELGARLAHPNVVTIHDFGRNERTFFMVMEYVDGLPVSKLAHRMRTASAIFPREVVAHIGRSLLRGLEHAHEHRVLHRDVCPQNILVSRLGEVKLTDFGIARVLGEAGEASTRTIAGHEAYIAPEQLEGRAGLGSDLFATGVVLWELLAGKRLFARDNPAATLLAVTAAVVPKFDDAWDAFFVRALARSPSERFATAREMLDALDAIPSARHEGAEERLAALVARCSGDEPASVEPAEQATIRDVVSSV